MSANFRTSNTSFFSIFRALADENIPKTAKYKKLHENAFFQNYFFLDVFNVISKNPEFFYFPDLFEIMDSYNIFEGQILILYGKTQKTGKNTRRTEKCEKRLNKF